MSQRRRSLLLLGVLSLGAAGCELIANFDRSEIDAGPIPEQDSSTPADSSTDAPKDTNQPDTTIQEAGADTNQPDTNQADTNQADTNQEDVTTDVGQDTGQDTSMPDSNGGDAQDGGTDAHDANVPDTNDANVADTNQPDTSDANVPDTNDSSTACNAIDLSTAAAIPHNDSTAAPPTMSGGTVPTTGTFVLSTDIYYADGGVGPTGTRKEVIVFSAVDTQWAHIESAGGGEVHETSTAALPVGTTVVETFSCGPSLTPATFTYDVSGSPKRTLILTTDGIEFRTYQEQ
jgi:hypothetical protein